MMIRNKIRYEIDDIKILFVQKQIYWALYDYKWDISYVDH
jgi:hypothetical protein